uniref:Rhodanese domain-containing protein n=1 Tax=Tetradesmus obliquus TaxID=3088 RepID=A0A383WCK4_TETOB|eukprot:jgi/Sobl393_1/224/SZX74963.1
MSSAAAIPAFGVPRCNIVVCGSGNGAQTAAAVLGSQGHTVWLYYSPRYQQRAAEMRAALAVNGGAITLTAHALPTAEAPDGTTTYKGPIQGVSTNAAELLAAADVVLLSVTAPAMEGLIRELAPHLRSQQLLLFLQGTGAVNYMMLKAALQDCVKAGPTSTSLADRMPMYAAAKVLPWACRLQAPAQVTVCGTKERVKLALAPDACGLLRVMLPRLLDGLFPGTRFLLDANAVLEHTYFPYGLLCSDVIHPGMMYGTWAAWDGTPLPHKPLFYHSASQEAADMIEELTADTRAVIAAMCKQMGLAEAIHVPDARELMSALYGPQVADPSCLLTALRSNAAYAGIYHPMKAVPLPAAAPAPAAAADPASRTGATGAEGAATGYVPDFSCRLLSEDVPFGLVATRGIAEVLGVATPCIDKVISWAQDKLGKEYLVGGKLSGKDVASSGAPQRFGVTRPEQLVIGAEGVAAAAGAGLAAPVVAAAAAAATTAAAAVQALLLPAQQFVGSRAAAQSVNASCADEREFLNGLRAQSCPVLCRPAVGSFTRARVCA